MRIDTLRALGSFVIAMTVIVGGFVFLDRLLHDLQDPNLAAIDAATVGIVVGGVMQVIGAVVTSLFTNESARGAARSTTNATQAGVSAALSTPMPSPGTVMATGTEATVTADGSGSIDFAAADKAMAEVLASGRPCLDCGRTAKEHTDDHEYRPM